ncbi:hypothetical protein BDM02DRAFT_3130871 [Thelephora ganbajun]|uniref:Uncharacterized protein n=1 Tax=Thelephora ganbajun TaxID=370292 RepID=A0ACB6Z865_THEGA|nr:hypothetical protein BDM02DRAFT_3130871 [Thelephora ganbajun]
MNIPTSTSGLCVFLQPSLSFCSHFDPTTSTSCAGFTARICGSGDTPQNWRDQSQYLQHIPFPTANPKASLHKATNNIKPVTGDFPSFNCPCPKLHLEKIVELPLLSDKHNLQNLSPLTATHADEGKTIRCVGKLQNNRLHEEAFMIHKEYKEQVQAVNVLKDERLMHFGPGLAVFVHTSSMVNENIRRLIVHIISI